MYLLFEYPSPKSHPSSINSRTNLFLIFSDNFFESLIFDRSKLLNFSFAITQHDITGPNNEPLPTSSTPMALPYLLMIFISISESLFAISVLIFLVPC